jgi:hypothetical protein
MHVDELRFSFPRNRPDEQSMHFFDPFADANFPAAQPQQPADPFVSLAKPIGQSVQANALYFNVAVTGQCA